MLTNTERQQIVEEVNAGTYGIDEALDDIAAAQKGEEVRKALYAEALVLNREGHAGSTDMIARQQIANLQTSVNGQISTLRTEVGEDIDDLETALNSGLATQNGKIAAQNATIANVVANYNVEYGSAELWASTGETGALAAGTTVTLSEDVSHFDYIDIYSFCGNSNVLDTVPVDAKLQSSQGYALRWVNLSDPDSGSYKAYVRIIETRLHIIGTTLTIDHQVTYRNGEEVNISGAEITQSNRSTYMGELGIMKIVGRKITANTEIEDVRIGADGTEYASAGQAVRAQVTALESAIPAVDSTLSTQGAAADAKVAGDKVAELKSALSETRDELNLGHLFTKWKQGTWYRDHNFDPSLQNRVTFAYTLPVTTGNIIQVKCGSGEKFARAAWTVNGSVYTNTLFGGWQTNDYRWIITENSEISIVVAKSVDGNITPEEVTTAITIYQSDDITAIDDIKSNKDSCDSLLGNVINPVYELGLVTYNNSDWVYQDGNTMIRTPKNRLMHLYKGMKIGLSDYTDARYYLGWVTEYGTKGFKGWLTEDYEITTNGYYSILVSNLTPTAQSNADALGNLIKITGIDVPEFLYVSDSIDLLDRGAQKQSINPIFLSEKFIAHRGSVVAPENTLIAFKRAIESGYKIVEYDVRFTSDNVPVLLHDETINRTARNADGTEISTTINIADITYQQALTYDFGIWKGSQYAGTKIPTLYEFLTLIKKHGVCGDTDLTTLGDDITTEQINIFMNIAKERGMLGNITFTSFFGGMRKIMSVEPNIIACIANLHTEEQVSVAYSVMKNAKMAMVSILSPYLNQETFSLVHNYGMYAKAVVMYNNEQINTNLEFAPDLMIVDTLGYDDIIVT